MMKWKEGVGNWPIDDVLELQGLSEEGIADIKAAAKVARGGLLWLIWSDLSEATQREINILT